MKPSLLLFVSVLFLTSCATITRGVHEKLKVESNPPGANVVLSTGEKGITPATFVEKRRRDNFTVTVMKPGYAPQTVTVVSKAGGTGATAMAGNVILGGVIGMGVDAGTGAYHSLYPNPVSVQLKPLHGNASSTTSSTSARKKSSTTTTRSSQAISPLPRPSASPH
jgi:hypothetical protein